MNKDNLINVEELISKINSNDLIIIDCRFNLKNKNYGLESYKKGHIPGAIFLNVETELSGAVKEHGGRHPLPEVISIYNILKNKGIHPDFNIVVYDDGYLSGACRARLILKYLGFKNIKILNGGFNEYKKHSNVISYYEPTYLTKEFKIKRIEDMFVDVNYVKSNLHNKNIALIDCREPNRYEGIFEPVDLTKGHIPNAMNYFWKDVLDEFTGLIKTKKELEIYFKNLKDFNEIILYCGSGITASVVSLALDEIGINHLIYPGGFSDWISYSENKVCIK